MPAQALSASIHAALNTFDVRQFRASNLALLNALGYLSDRTQAIPGADPQAFRAIVESHSGKTLNADKAKFAEWKQADLLFQFTDEELSEHKNLFQDAAVNASQMRSYLFFAVELSGPKYSRTDLATIARQINRLFPMPVTVTFSYANKLSMAVINRRPHARDESRDVLGHVSLIREIDVNNPHRAHLDVLQELSLPNRLKWADDHNKPRNFDGLLAAWLAVLDTEELNRQFYKDLFAWFERAVTTARFPTDETKTLPPEEHVIRLITRLLFIWFIKEKGLIADALFNETQVAGLLTHYDPNTGDSYYRAVLQNLFFATLNTEINKRGFSKETHTTHRDFSRYRYKAEMHDPDKLVALFRRTPFINGGLFDCLDSEAATRDGGWRIDCFTDNPRSRSGYSIPNRLFFSRDKNNPGVVTLFDKYKFTVEENTPAEQEVALDPELLGKVFENLLAAYNPETRDTARKQTGSYYTPRAVVDYMVDEALTAYLSETAHPTDTVDIQGQKQTAAQPSASSPNPPSPSPLPTATTPRHSRPSPCHSRPSLCHSRPSLCHSRESGNPSDTPWQQRIRYLLDYTDPFDDAEQLFTATERDHIIQAIATIKVLDPAVGSGAFPMGILHKLTLALRRLDPDNTHWETLQKESAKQKAASAFDVHNQQDRDAELNDISTTFEHYRDSDFGRKLYLIQNSIYGVDVQPVASQIAKLRFFISLAIEQEPTGNAKDNYGIKPLPNLETRFVAANTLLALDNRKGMLTSLRVRELQQELQENRERHFHATTRSTKRKYREKDEKLRNDLATELENLRLPADAARKIANWDPYDQNASADWFVAEYMFGVTNGFDVVIGNPPYVVTNDKHLRELYKEGVYGRANTYGLFIHRGLQLTTESGQLSFINPRTLLTDRYFTNLRKVIKQKSELKGIVLIADRHNTFESVLQECIILHLIGKSNLAGPYIVNTRAITRPDDLSNPQSQVSISSDRVLLGDDYDRAFYIGVSEFDYHVFDRMNDAGVKLADFGLKAETGKVQFDKYQKYAQPTNANGAARLIWAENIQRYVRRESRNRIGKEWLSKDIIPVVSPNITGTGIVTQRTSANEQPRRIIATLVTPENVEAAQIYSENGTNFVALGNDSKTNAFLTGALNSSLIEFAFRRLNSNVHVSAGEINSLPFPPMPEGEMLKEIESLVAELIQSGGVDSPVDKIRQAITNERRLDVLIGSLYGLSASEVEQVQSQLPSYETVYGL